MIEESHEIIDIDEVVKSLQEQQEQVVNPEPVSSDSSSTLVFSNLVISTLILFKYYTTHNLLEIG